MAAKKPVFSKRFNDALASMAIITKANAMTKTGSFCSRNNFVVEDDTDVRTTVVMMLNSLGYTTQQAENGRAALAILQSSANIDLIFTDLILRGDMSGADLTHQGRARKPTAKGFIHVRVSRKILSELDHVDPAIALLKKPYRKHELAEMVRNTLDADDGNTCKSYCIH